MVFLLLVTLLGGGFLTWKFYDITAKKWETVVAWAEDFFGKLTSQKITESFRESVTRITATHGDILEVAVLETDETVTKYDMRTMFNELVYLGTTVSEIRAPVVYRYHIKLSDEWDLRVEDGRCIVHAPVIRPSLPPAVRTDGIQKKSEAGWLRFNAAENLAELEKSLTPTMERRAGTPRHIQLVREPSRKAVAEFVKAWLLKEAAARGTEVRSITVVFSDELKKAAEPLTLPPTLEWQPAQSP